MEHGVGCGAEWSVGRGAAWGRAGAQGTAERRVEVCASGGTPRGGTGQRAARPEWSAWGAPRSAGSGPGAEQGAECGARGAGRETREAGPCGRSGEGGAVRKVARRYARHGAGNGTGWTGEAARRAGSGACAGGRVRCWERGRVRSLRGRLLLPALPSPHAPPSVSPTHSPADCAPRPHTPRPAPRALRSLHFPPPAARVRMVVCKGPEASRADSWRVLRSWSGGRAVRLPSVPAAVQRSSEGHLPELTSTRRSARCRGPTRRSSQGSFESPCGMAHASRATRPFGRRSCPSGAP